jgi:hypothetical protein
MVRIDDASGSIILWKKSKYYTKNSYRDIIEMLLFAGQVLVFPPFALLEKPEVVSASLQQPRLRIATFTRLSNQGCVFPP